MSGKCSGSNQQLRCQEAQGCCHACWNSPAPEARQTIAPGVNPGWMLAKTQVPRGGTGPGPCGEADFFRPSGSEWDSRPNPRLTPCATTFRRSAAGRRRVVTLFRETQ